MTTAARPTFDSARGLRQDRSAAQSHQVRARDLVLTDLKVRQPGQSTKKDVSSRDLKTELENKELKYRKKIKAALPASFLALYGDVKGFDADRDDDGDDDDDRLGEIEAEGEVPAEIDSAHLSSDDAEHHSIDEADESGASRNVEQSSSEDSDDEEAELMRELQRIKQEREDDRINSEQRQHEQLEQEKEERALHGNPLLAASQGFQVKRRWDEDVVFKNQAKGVDENPKKRFINDMIRSDFHKKFLQRYVR